MRTSSRMMLWYFWRMSCRSLLLFPVLCAVAAIAIHALKPANAEAVYAYVNLVVQVFLITAFGGCMFVWSDGKSYVPAPFLLTLPLSTRRYQVLFYGYVTAVVGAVSFAATGLHLFLFGNEIQAIGSVAALGFWQMPLLCVALACLIQSMFHLAGISSELRVVPMAIAMEVLAFLCLLSVLDPGNLNSLWIKITSVVALLVAWDASQHSLTAYRNGRHRNSIAALLELFALERGRTRPFSSPGGALFWLNWRRYGRLFPLWSLGLGSVCMIFAFGFFSLDQELAFASKNGARYFLAYVVSLPALVAAALLCHLFHLGRTQEDFLGTGRGYFLSLPVHSAAFARGRLLAVALSVLIVIALEMFMYFLFIWRTPTLGQNEVFGMFMNGLFCLLGVWVVLWFGLAIAVGYAVLFPLFLLVTFYSTEAGYFHHGMFALSLPLTLFFLAVAVRRRLLSRADLIHFALALLIPMAAGMAFVLEFDPYIKGINLRTVLENVHFLLPIALPFVAAPVLVDWARHR